MSPLIHGLVHIRGGRVYSPRNLGVKDILVVGEKIVGIGEDFRLPTGLGTSVVDASGMMVLPGFVDPHVHVLGGGGEGGPVTRTPEIEPAQVFAGGITTVVGVLGTDNVTRSLEALLAKTRALCLQGLSTFMFTGSFHYPPSTLTGGVKKDVAFIRECVGVKTAVSDHRGSHMTVDELARLSSGARFGGMLAGKKGVVHVHLGDGEEGLGPIRTLLEKGEIPITQFHPTHVSRNPRLFQEGLAFVREGGSMDLNPEPRVEDTVELVSRMAGSGIDLGRVTFSSDGNGSHCEFDENGELSRIGVSSVSVLMESFRGIVESGILPMEDALGFFTRNPAGILALRGKGQLEVGADADLILLDADLKLNAVMARGRMRMTEGQVRGPDIRMNGAN